VSRVKGCKTQDNAQSGTWHAQDTHRHTHTHYSGALVLVLRLQRLNNGNQAGISTPQPADIRVVSSSKHRYVPCTTLLKIQDRTMTDRPENDSLENDGRIRGYGQIRSNRVENPGSRFVLSVYTIYLFTHSPTLTVLIFFVY